MNYTKIDIKDLIENYKKSDKRKIKFLPKSNKKDKIVEEWFETEDIKTLSNTSGETSIEIVNILENTGVL